MMSKEEIEAEANEWIRSQGWSEETLPSDEYNQMVSAYVAGHYAGWNAKADEKSGQGVSLTAAEVRRLVFTAYKMGENVEKTKTR